jgi:hypothetical protein
MAGLVPAIHVCFFLKIKDVDARHKAGHDEFVAKPAHITTTAIADATDICEPCPQAGEISG